MFIIKNISYKVILSKHPTHMQKDTITIVDNLKNKFKKLFLDNDLLSDLDEIKRRLETNQPITEYVDNDKGSLCTAFIPFVKGVFLFDIADEIKDSQFSQFITISANLENIFTDLTKDDREPNADEQEKIISELKTFLQIAKDPKFLLNR
jgi:hypothetical protein